MTAQFPDEIIINQEVEMMCSNPLETYLDRKKLNPEVLSTPSCTACWRGYIATWEIRDGKLFLVKVMAYLTKEDILAEIFPDAEGEVWAEWVTDILRVPRGEQLEYVHLGYMSQYERDLLITVEKGVVIEMEEVDNTQKMEEPRRPPMVDDDEDSPPPPPGWKQ